MDPEDSLFGDVTVVELGQYIAALYCAELLAHGGAEAASGLMRSLGRREEGRAVPSDVMIADYTTGTLLAFGVAATLRHRDRTGRGQRVATSLMAPARRPRGWGSTPTRSCGSLGMTRT